MLASNTSTGTLECRTQPAADPLAAEGLLCAVLVEVLDEQSGTALATAELVDGFQMRSQASSPLITAASASSGSTEGGLLLCLHGERLALTLTLILTLTLTLTLSLSLTLALTLASARAATTSSRRPRAVTRCTAGVTSSPATSAG